MTTNIPPYNCSEIIDAACKIIDMSNISVEDFCNIVHDPDVPTGCAIIGIDSSRCHLATGPSIITVRGITSVEELPNGKEQIIITEIPYAVNCAVLMTKIAELAMKRF
jgi:DNA gyrase subunit A